MSKNAEEKIVIIGAGIIGKITALSLASKGIDIEIIDKSKDLNLKDARNIALSYGSFKFLCKILGDNPDIKNSYEKYKEVEPIWHIITLHRNNYLMFDHQKVHDDPIGFMIPMNDLHELINKGLKKLKIRVKSGVEIKSVKNNNNKVSIIAIDENGKESTVDAKLLIAADGRNSWIRDHLGFSIRNKPYHQHGGVFNIKHSNPHLGRAFEVFTSWGALAILPSKGKESSVVLSIKDKLMEELTKNLEKGIEELIEGALGKIELVNEIKFYPLNLTYCKKPFKERVVLVGDAAHAVHPIAGQGMNLSIRDIEVLADLIVRNRRLGLDYNNGMLEEYYRSRLIDTYSIITSTHLLNHVFNKRILEPINTIGFKLINGFSKIKERMMKHAMGID